VCYTVGRLNIRRTTSLASNLSPYRLFTGTRVNYKKSLQLAFGDYAEVFDGSDNISRSRTIPCIALHPCNNATGSLEFLNLISGKRGRRSNWTKMVTTKMIIDKMNNMTAAKITEEAELSQAPEVITPRPRAPIITMRATAADETEIEDAPAEQNLIETATEHVESTETTTDSEIATEPVAASESAEATEPVETSETTEELQSVSEVPVRRSERIARGISRPERYMLLTKIQKAMKTLAIDKEQAKFDAIQKEIIQFFEELKAIVPVMIADVPKDAEDLRCFIFLVEKFLANGEFNKIKARLVANRAQQKKELYPNKSSPTASVHAIFTCLTLVAYMCSYKVAKVDVKGAYIQTEISGSPIYMKMDKKLMTLALSILPSL
jgi:hypothetical protein